MEYFEGQTEFIDFDLEDSKHISVHIHPQIEILYILDGNICLTFADREYFMKKNDVVVINTNIKHSYRASGPVLVGIIHMNYRLVNSYLNQQKYSFLCNSVVDKNEGYEEIREILDKIFPLYFEKKEQQVYLNSLYFYLLYRLIENFSVHVQKTVPDLGMQVKKDRIQEILLYIQENFRYPISLQKMADHFHLSESYLSKYIKKNLGMNLGKYLIQLRLNNAVKEMYTSRKSLTRISLDNGFPNAAAFTQAFKSKYGETPSAWKTTHLDQILMKQKRRNQQLQNKGERIKKYLENQIATKKIISKPSGRIFEVDAAKSRPYQKNWNQIINIGPMETLLRFDIQEHLLILQKELNFKYVRFWNVFSDEMLTEINKKDGIKNFSRLDKGLDFIVENNMHPFIELGFKPVVLIKSLDCAKVFKEKEIPVHFKETFAELLYSILIHCVNRYGINEVEKWYFEQWGDPRLISEQGFGEYFDVFETAYRTIKSISASIHVGGAGFGRLYTMLDFKEIMSLWKKREVHPDFISLYSYPYRARSKGKALNEDRIQDSNFVHNQILMMKEVQRDVSMTDSAILVTEWSSSVSNWNSLNDSLYKGAFLLKTIIDNIDTVDMMGYWMATDLLAEYYDTGTFLHGGNGLLSEYGIKKPAFYAFEFAKGMEEFILGRDKNSIITTNGQNTYSIVCHNFIKPNYKYYLKKEDEVDVKKQFLLFDHAETLQLDFRICGIKSGKYIVKIHSLNAEHGSVQDVWAQMGYSENLSRKDMEYLRNISIPQIFIRECTVEDNILEISAILKPHEIQAIHITFQME